MNRDLRNQPPVPQHEDLKHIKLSDGSHAIQHKQTKEFLIEGTREECIEFNNKYE